MIIGETLTIGKWRFQLLRADEYTYKYMKLKPDSWPQAQISHVMARLKKCKQRSCGRSWLFCSGKQVWIDGRIFSVAAETD